MKDKLLLKIFSVLLTALMLYGCEEDCDEAMPITVGSTVDQVKYFAFANQTQFVFLYNADSGFTIPHQFTLSSTSFTNEKITLQIGGNYAQSYTQCSSDKTAYIHFNRKIFLSDEAKHTNMYINVKPVKTTKSTYSYDRYIMQYGSVAELVINNEQFYIDSVTFTSKANYLDNVNFGGKNFTNVYLVKGVNGGDLYLSRDKIAHIKIGKRTWTNMSN